MSKARRIKGIDCNAAAGEGIKLVLAGRFAEMSRLRKSALNWNDLEGVHSMRVASRRLRSALRDFTPYLKKRGLTSSLRQIKQVADMLGRVRDQDVAILALQQLRANAPAEVSEVLGELVQIGQQSRDKARQQLASVITRSHLKSLQSTFAAAIDFSATRSNKSQARRPEPNYVEMAGSIILERLKELEKLSNSLYRPWKIRQLHDMRIAAKRLRYAIELFQECWGKAIAPFADEVARLQQSLGELHDCDVWIESFGEHITESKKKREADQSDAFAWLLNRFIETRNQHFSDAFDIWREWEARGLSSMLRELVTPVQVPATPVEVPADSNKVATASNDIAAESGEVTAVPIEAPTVSFVVPAVSIEVPAVPVEVPVIPAQVLEVKARKKKPVKNKTAAIPGED
jgi:CHAD domain-containing protein